MGNTVPAAGELYHCAPGVRWAVETRGVAVFHPDKGVFATLEYPEAAVWDLASRGYRFDRIAELVGHIAGVERPAAESLVIDALERWLAMGLLEKGEADG